MQSEPVAGRCEIICPLGAGGFALRAVLMRLLASVPGARYASAMAARAPSLLAVGRRRRYTTCISEGTLAFARVIAIKPKDVGFGVKHPKVRHEFDADGRTHHDSDLVLPVIADRWNRRRFRSCISQHATTRATSSARRRSVHL
ncbi:MAG TPA: hypothetical protein VGQ52_09000 [Gemmatimonadaceae bacterium]|nr:hypothetical protein [Gemmatimonadaceae bacterium]